MRMPWRVLSAAAIASSVAWIGGPADAAPLSAPLALKSADAASVETVQWRRGRGGRWIGPAAGFAAGVAIGSAFAPRYDGYYGAYAYDPGYAYESYAYEGYATVPVRRSYRGVDCTGEESADSANPSWACPRWR